MLTKEQQRQELNRLVQDSAGWHVLVYVETPGDVSFLVSPVPKLAGYEIVCASGLDEYDVWYRHPLTNELRLHLADQTRHQIGTWIRTNTPDEETLKTNAEHWTRTLLSRYGSL